LNYYYLSIDAGSSGCKVALADRNAIFLALKKSEWSYFSPEDLEPFGVEFNADKFWNIIISTIKQVIDQSGVSIDAIKAISVSSQRHGCVFLDKNGDEIYAGPNRDARGLEVDIDDYIESDELFKITGQNPYFLFGLARYLWFKENNEEKFDTIHKILTIDSWIAYKLTGKYVIDSTSASATQLMDIKTKKWSDTILSQCEISKDILPEIVVSNTIIGEISNNIKEEIDLNSNIIVTLAGADSQLALLGCGAIEVGDTVIIAGSTMPIMQVIDQPILDPQNKIWTGSFFEHEKWVIEANAGPAGSLYSWFITNFIKKLNSSDDFHMIFENLVESQSLGVNDVYADLGVQIFNSQKMTEVVSSKFVFPQVSISLNSEIGINSFSQALFENLAFAVKANIEQIHKVTNKKNNRVFLVGGLSRSKSLIKILANVLNEPIDLVEPESTLLGGILSCLVVSGESNNYTEAIKLITDRKGQVNPAEDLVRLYEGCYHHWKELYDNNRLEFE
jgi:autoinducer 2 (AI-2) kinase